MFQPIGHHQQQFPREQKHLMMADGPKHVVQNKITA
jgi:hypothetical protein